MEAPVASLAIVASLALATHLLADSMKISFSRLVGMRLGLVTEGEVDEMERLYQEAAQVKRRQEPVVRIFDDGDLSASRLLELLTPRQKEIIRLRGEGSFRQKRSPKRSG